VVLENAAEAQLDHSYEKWRSIADLTVTNTVKRKKVHWIFHTLRGNSPLKRVIGER